VFCGAKHHFAEGGQNSSTGFGRIFPVRKTKAPMPKINDLNLKNWKKKIITIYGDKYKIRRTYDIDDFLGFGIYGYEINDEQGNYLFYYQGYDEKDLIKHIKYKIYKQFIV